LKEELLSHVPLFAELTAAERAALAEHAQLRTYQPDEQVFARGTRSDAFFLVNEGWVRLAHEGGRSAVATLGPGSLLGEVDFFTGAARSINAYAMTPLSLWVFEESAVNEVMRRHPELGIKLGIALGCGIAQYRPYLVERLAHVPLLQGLEREGRQAVAERLSPQRYQPNQVIFRSGDVPSGLFLIERGSVRLISDQGRALELGAGDTCGELAALTNKPHAHTAQAVTEVVVWQLSQAEFARLIESYPHLRLALGRNLRAPLSAADRVQAAAVLGRMPLFADLSRPELDDVAAHLVVRHVPAGEDVYQPGDPGDAMYVVESGQVEIITGDEVGRPRTLARMIPGDFFGEMALLTGQSRTVTARAVTHSNLWVLYRTDFDRLLVQHPGLTANLSRTLRERLAQARGSSIAAHLHKLATMGDLTRMQLDELAQRLTPHTFQAGSVIFRQGWLGDTLYFVESGRVELVASTPRGPVVLETLGSGDFCGEAPLLTGRSHTATARVVEDARLWALTKSDFDGLVAKYPKLAVVLSRALSERQTDALNTLRAVAPAPTPRPTPPSAVGRPAQPASARPKPRPSRMEPPPPAQAQAQTQAPARPATAAPRPRPAAPPPGRPQSAPSAPPPPLPPRPAPAPARPAPVEAAPGVSSSPSRPAAAPTEQPQAAPERASGQPVPVRVVRPVTPSSGPVSQPPGRPGTAASTPPTTERTARPAADETLRPGALRPERPAASSRATGVPSTRPEPPLVRPAAPEARAAAAASATAGRPAADKTITRAAGLERKGIRARLRDKIGRLAVWFSSRSRRVKIGLLLLFMLLIWLCGITLPSTLIMGLAASLNSNGNTSGGSYVDGDEALLAQSPFILLQRMSEHGLVAALPFLETVTPTPSPTSTPTETPTLTPTPTGTWLPTWTPTPAPTHTPLPPTETPTPAEPPTPTRAPRPRAPTDTPTPEPTPTPDVDYMVASVRQLTPCENNGNHHIYVRVVDQNGSGINGIPLRICWGAGENDCARPLTETKSNGPGWVEFAMFKGTYNVRVDGAKSQVASGLTADYQKDELCPENGNAVANSLYHASFEVIMQKVR